MNKKLNCIMLVDDCQADNFFHERAIKKTNAENIIVTKNTGKEALEYLKSRKDENTQPDLIFLDINMPSMNGWEFLQEFHHLDKEIQGRTMIIMLTSSENSEDKARARTWSFVSDYLTKALTTKSMKDVITKYFE